mmetsp:Transcript_42091/g.83094  ORF Transcript_42091/g.83094 Transcript_42091/m.83094 type:complete len:207 (+) Transcript_42091:2-622(+)
MGLRPPAPATSASSSTAAPSAASAASSIPVAVLPGIISVVSVASSSIEVAAASSTSAATSSLVLVLVRGGVLGRLLVLGLLFLLGGFHGGRLIFIIAVVPQQPDESVFCAHRVFRHCLCFLLLLSSFSCTLLCLGTDFALDPFSTGREKLRKISLATQAQNKYTCNRQQIRKKQSDAGPTAGTRLKRKEFRLPSRVFNRNYSRQGD